MTDDRYTVENPPEKGARVWFTDTWRSDTEPERGRWDAYHSQVRALQNGLVHRTEESAQAHARRMLMADEILEALEAMVLAVGRPGTAQNLAVLGANRVIAKARGEVAG
jgi:hypothetical protein